MSLEKRVKEFLRQFWDGKSPLLLGYSGGPDSKALLYALLSAGCHSLHIAHVDHGWRKESGEEASFLEREISQLGLPFYQKRLTPSKCGNLEALAREERFSFFRSLFDQTPFQALLLGHQKDDLAETVLKRLLEGAHPVFLEGMKSTGEVASMPIWRPLLEVRKREVLTFLKKKGLTFFTDPTNSDSSFLRARLRQTSLPFLTQSFGKEVVPNLALLSERAREWQEYLEEKTQSSIVKEHEWGFALDCYPLHRIERRYLLQKKTKEKGVILPRTVLEPVLDWLEEKKGGRKIFFQSLWVMVARGWVFVLKNMPDPQFLQKIGFDKW